LFQISVLICEKAFSIFIWYTSWHFINAKISNIVYR
jgi:hypothetical protein